MTYDVIIIGAGIAGFAAAYEAKKRGFSFLLLEAQNRMGGRIHSLTLNNGLVVELGAEWIGNTHKEMLVLCKELGLQLEPHRFDANRMIFKNGKEQMSFPHLIQRFETVVKASEATQIKRSLSMYTYLKPSFTRREMYQLNLIYSPDFAQHLRYVSAATGIADILSGGKNDHMDFHIKGGNSRLIDALAKKVSKKNIRLSCAVTKIERLKKCHRIQTNTGDTFTADHIIVATSASAFSKIQTEPKLPKHKSMARNLKYGDITKLFVSFDTPLAFDRQNFSMTTNGPLQYVYVCSQGQSKNKFALCTYSVGKRARQLMLMSEGEIWEELKNTLPRDIFDTSRMKPSQIVSKHWGEDVFTHGAYAVFQPCEHEKISSQFLDQASGILFAGEHLGTLTGYMAGALQSGIVAAKKIQKMKKLTRNSIDVLNSGTTMTINHPLTRSPKKAITSQST